MSRVHRLNFVSVCAERRWAEMFALLQQGSWHGNERGVNKTRETPFVNFVNQDDLIYLAVNCLWFSRITYFRIDSK
jgi:hypothetical protein